MYIFHRELAILQKKAQSIKCEAKKQKEVWNGLPLVYKLKRI